VINLPTDLTSSPAGIDCPGTACSAQFAEGTSVMLTATPNGFVGWSGGGCSGTGTCQLTVSGDTSVTAFFAHPLRPARPNTRLGNTKIRSNKRTATFAFKDVGAAMRFQCALPRNNARPAFRRCVSPKRYRHLRPATYTFEARALNGALADLTPAKKKFTIRR
jgi:hypothetical protein